MEDEEFHVVRACPRAFGWPGLVGRLLYFQSANERRKYGRYLEEITARPGDILLFQGTGTSLIQQLAFGTRWSHIAIVYEDEDGLLTFAQADRHKVPVDLLHDEPDPECAISVVPFDVGIRDFLENPEVGGVNVVLRRLVLPDDSDARRASINAAIRDEIEECANTPFERHLDTFVAIAYPWVSMALVAPFYLCGADADDDDSPVHTEHGRAIYCSQFVARCYARAGVFEPSVLHPDSHALHSNIAPAHFDMWNETPLSAHDARGGRKPHRHAVPFLPAERTDAGRARNMGFGKPIYVR